MEVHIDPEVSKHQEIIDAITSATTALSQRSPESPASQQHTELTEKESILTKTMSLATSLLMRSKIKMNPPEMLKKLYICYLMNTMLTEKYLKTFI